MVLKLQRQDCTHVCIPVYIEMQLTNVVGHMVYRRCHVQSKHPSSLDAKLTRISSRFHQCSACRWPGLNPVLLKLRSSLRFSYPMLCSEASAVLRVRRSEMDGQTGEMGYHGDTRHAIAAVAELFSLAVHVRFCFRCLPSATSMPATASDTWEVNRSARCWAGFSSKRTMTHCTNDAVARES